MNIYSGIGYYNNEAEYIFEKSNLNTIKRHLNKLFPRIILFYNFDSDNLGDTNNNFGCVSFKVHKFTIKEESKTIIFIQEIEDEDFFK